MPTIEVHNRCSDFNSYRAARVKSLFNAESGCNFDLVAELPIEGQDWQVGVVVGPSGSGKTSMGRQLFGGGSFYEPEGWPDDAPIIDAICPDGDFNAVTGALATVGLGDVPAWLRPYGVLSNGERFRADLARIVSEGRESVVVDEFTSVVDRQIARIGSSAFSKAWRRTKGQAVLLSCHYDILDWLEPDWVFDTATGKFHGRWLQQGRHDGQEGWYKRPRFELEIWQTNWDYWPLFEPHHYLKIPKMVAATCYVGAVNGEPVCHMAVSTRAAGGTHHGMEARACRLVVMPEWQGAGVGLKFLNYVCEQWLEGNNPRGGKRMTTLFHTSHPGLCAVLRRLPQWRQVSFATHGGNKNRSARSLEKSGMEGKSGYGGHVRAIQGFRYYGQAGVEAAEQRGRQAPKKRTRRRKR